MRNATKPEKARAVVVEVTAAAVAVAEHPGSSKHQQQTTHPRGLQPLLTVPPPSCGLAAGGGSVRLFAGAGDGIGN